MSVLTQPRGQIALGWAVINGQRVPVVADPEWVRFFSTLADRAGGTSGLSTSDVDAGSFAAMQPAAFDSFFSDTAQCGVAAGDAQNDAMQPALISDQFIEVLQADCMQASEIYPMQV